MNRFFLAADAWQEGRVLLQGDEARHCSRVMRARPGDEIELFDGVGRSARATIESVSKSEVVCRLDELARDEAVIFPLTLCQAIPKGGNMEWIVQKAVELGVAEIQPLITAHTVARPEALAKKQAKWQRVALEACKQCGQNVLPVVLPPLSFASWQEGAPQFDLAVVASLEAGAVGIKSLFPLPEEQGRVALLVGPEGDFSEQEYQAARVMGFQPVSFGGIVMRVETAALYGLSVLQHELRHG